MNQEERIKDMETILHRGCRVIKSWEDRRKAIDKDLPIVTFGWDDGTRVQIAFDEEVM